MKNTSFLKFATPFFLGLFCTAAAFADVKVSAASSTPVKTSILSVAGEGSGNIRWYRFNTGNSRRDIGQTFQPPADTSINSLVLKIAPLEEALAVGVTAPGSGFILRFYEYDGENIVDATPVSAQAGRLPDEIAAGDFLTFNFDKVPLRHDRFYALVLSFESPDPERYLNFQTVGPDAANNGNLLMYGTHPEQSPREAIYHHGQGHLHFQLSRAEP